MNETSMQYAAAFVGLNLLAVALMMLDKKAAKKKAWRVPEASLFMLALLGASPAILACMQLLRHKISKPSFKWRIYVILWLQIMALLAYGFLTRF